MTTHRYPRRSTLAAHVRARRAARLPFGAFPSFVETAADWERYLAGYRTRTWSRANHRMLMRPVSGEVACAAKNAVLSALYGIG